MHEKMLQILEWYASEMAENLEVFECLNFAYGLIGQLKDWDKAHFEEAVKVMNSGYFEELLPVHAQVLILSSFGNNY